MHMWHREKGEPPHVVAALADKVPLRDDCLSVPEMRAILTLSGGRAVEEGHLHCEIIPLSLLPSRTCSNRLYVALTLDSRRSHLSLPRASSSVFCKALSTAGISRSKSERAESSTFQRARSRIGRSG